MRTLNKSPHPKAYTLLEVSMVLGLAVALTTITIFGIGQSSAIARAARAEAAMRMIESARLSYLSDNPTRVVGTVLPTDLDPYIPGGFTNALAVITNNGYSMSLPRDIRTARIGYSMDPGVTQRVRGFEAR